MHTFSRLNVTKTMILIVEVVTEIILKLEYTSTQNIVHYATVEELKTKISTSFHIVSISNGVT